MSASASVPIRLPAAGGGVPVAVALNDDDVFEEARNLVVLYEGLHTYGGLAGRDMEAMAIGIAEAVSEDHIRARIGQVEYVGEG